MSSIHLLLNSPVSPAAYNTRRSIKVENGRISVTSNGRRVLACATADVRSPESAASSAGKLRSAEVMEADARVLVGTYARAPVVLSSGKGCKLYDLEGREYLDMTAGIAVNALGHGDPDWVRAVTEQASVLTHVSNLYYSIPQVRKNSEFVFFFGMQS